MYSHGPIGNECHKLIHISQKGWPVRIRQLHSLSLLVRFFRLVHMNHTLSGLQDAIEILRKLYLEWISLSTGRVDRVICTERICMQQHSQQVGAVDNNQISVGATSKPNHWSTSFWVLKLSLGWNIQKLSMVWFDHK